MTLDLVGVSYAAVVPVTNSQPIPFKQRGCQVSDTSTVPPADDDEQAPRYITEAVAAFAGARRPDRRRRVNSSGVNISVVEWGDADGPPLLMAHGGFDFAETLNGFAPLLADAGWRVVSWDRSGHGDSDHADLYSFQADIDNAVLHSTTDRAIPGLATPRAACSPCSSPR